MNIEKLKSSLPCLDVMINDMGLSPKPWKPNASNACIFCDEHPNHPEKLRAKVKYTSENQSGTYECFGEDGHYGDIFDLIVKLHSVSFNDAVKFVKNHYKISIGADVKEYFSTGRQEDKTDSFCKQAHWRAHYLKKALKDLRSKSGLEKLKKWFPKVKTESPVLEYIGWNDQTETPSICIEKIERNLQYWHNVSDYKRPNINAKWIGLKGRSMIPFPEKLFKERPGYWVVVTEGLKDCVNAWLQGFKAITLGGGMVPWKEHLHMLENHGVILARDLDKAGMVFQKRFLRDVKESGVYIPQIYGVDWTELSTKEGFDFSDAQINLPGMDILDLQALADTYIDSRKEEDIPLNSQGKRKKPAPPIRISAFNNGWRIWAGMRSQIMFMQSMKTGEVEEFKGPDFWHQLDMRINTRTNSFQRYGMPIKREVFDPNQLNQFFYNKSAEEYCYNRFNSTENWMLEKKKDTEVPPLISTIIANILGLPFQPGEWGEQGQSIFDHFINWLACFYQTREKSTTAWIFSGEKGTGKNLFFEHVLWPIFGEKQCILVGNDDLEDTFGSWQAEKLFVVFNELSQDTQARHKMKDKIKTYVTERKVRIRRMHVEADHGQENTFNVMIFTNDSNPFKVEEGDRRFNIMHSAIKLEEYCEFVDLNIGRTFSDSIPEMKREVRAFAEHLASVDIDQYWYNKTIETHAKIEMINRSKTITYKLWEALVNKNLNFFIENDLVSTEQHSAAIVSPYTEDQVMKEILEAGFIPNAMLKSIYKKATNKDKSPYQIKTALQASGVTLSNINSKKTFLGKTRAGLEF